MPAPWPGSSRAAVGSLGGDPTAAAGRRRGTAVPLVRERGGGPGGEPERPHYRARIVSEDGSLHALITGEGQAYEPVPVQRPNAQTARFQFPAGIFLLNAHVDVAPRSVCTGGSCAPARKDRAPDSGWLTVTTP